MSERRVISIVDYGVGNLMNVARAVEHVGATPRLLRSAGEIAQADHLLLPGVGAFGDCADAIRRAGVDEAVRKHIDRERPLLGVCVGMQVLFESSEEFGHQEGLRVFSGRVRMLPAETLDGAKLRRPSIGWKVLREPRPGRWTNTICEGLSAGASVYFVHSFAGVPENPEDILAETDFGGHAVCAAIMRGNVVATQFHPEKSGPVGLEMLRRFAEL